MMYYTTSSSVPTDPVKNNSFTIFRYIVDFNNA